MTVEKNDVSLAPLFHWSKRFILQDLEENDIEVFIRLVGDSQLNRARVYALRKSAELRKNLKDVTADDRLAFIAEAEGLERDQLTNIIITLSLRDITQEAVKNVRLPYPKEPKSDATLEQQEKYQEEVDKYPLERETKLREYITNSMTKAKEALDGSTEEELYKIYERALIAELCESETLRAFADMCTYLGCFKDEGFTELYFKDLEEFTSLPSEIKEQFISAYRSLELSSDELKKSRGATQ